MNLVTSENWTLNSLPTACDFTWTLLFSQPRKSTNCAWVSEFWLFFNFGELLKEKSKWKRKQFFFYATGPMHIGATLKGNTFGNTFGEARLAQKRHRI